VQLSVLLTFNKLKSLVTSATELADIIATHELTKVLLSAFRPPYFTIDPCDAAGFAHSQRNER
jgi:hypothetical protein